MIKIGSFCIPQLPALTYIITLSFLLPSFLLIFLTTDVHSSDVKVEASVTPQHIQLNERATLKLKISGNTLMKHIEAPSFNFLPNFLAVPLHSKTTPRLVEDKLTVSMSWIYELIPQKVGEVALPDVRFSYQGLPYNANPGIITVGSVDKYIDTATDGIHTVEATVNNKKPYLNEAIEYHFRYLYTTVLPTRESPSYALPTLTGFLVEEVSDNSATTTRINGRTYHVDEYVKRLYPQKTGKILIPPAALKLPIKGNPKTLKTKSIALNVQPLPEIGKPANFDGAIGEYSISSSVDRRRLEVRKALTLTVTITRTGTGSGNINTVTSPKITPMNGFRTDAPILAHGNSANSRIYHYAIIPLKSGILQIPGVELSYFNPTKDIYQTSKTDPISLTVTPNPNGTVDIESDGLHWVLWLLLCIPILVLAVGGYLIYRLKAKSGNDKSLSDPSMDASVQAMSSLQSLGANETAIDAAAFVESITGIIRQYLCAKNLYNRQETALQQLTQQEIQDIGKQIGISDTDQKELLDIVTKCNYHRFAPVPLTDNERTSLISRVEKVINNIEST